MTKPTYVVTCSRCGITTAPFRTWPLRCRCGMLYRHDGDEGVSISERGLGDRLAALFQRLGIEKRPGCGCAKRQAKLNNWSQRAWLKYQSWLIWLHSR